MTFKQIAIAYPIAAVLFLALDAVWLSTMADRIYRPGIGHLMQEKFSFAPALVFYVIYVAGMLAFAVAPGLAQEKGWPVSLAWGAGLGFIAYATYNLTNHSTLKDWPISVTLADMTWGTVVTAVSAAGACFITQWITSRNAV